MRWLARHAAAACALVAAIAAACLVPDLVGENHNQDLFIYRGGAQLALAGNSPYDVPRLHALVAEAYPDQPLFVANHGFFLSPAGAAVFAPVTLLPWPTAKWAWALLSYTLAGAGAASLVKLAGPAARARFSGWHRPVVAAAVMWDPLIYIGTVVGQTSAAVFGLLALGEVARRVGRAWVGAACWGVAFIKPHLALMLLPLAAFLGGWRYAVRVAAVAAALLAVGVALCGGPGVLPEYVAHLRDAHKACEFNKVTWNPQLSSWNRVLLTAGGPPVELGAGLTLAGYAAWAGLVLARVALAGGLPSPAWAIAAAVTGAMVCCQLLPYEMLLMGLVLPLALDWFAAGRPAVGWLLVAALALKSTPFEVGMWLHTESGLPERVGLTVMAVRSVGVLAVAAVVLGAGWPEATSPPGPLSETERG